MIQPTQIGFVTAALLWSVSVWAGTEDNAQPERDYLPEDIVVTGQRDGYRVDDGFTATKTATPIIDVPQTITAITRDQLDDQNVRSLNDALRFVPGVSMESGEGHRDEVFIRGQETTADFYLDGLRDDAEYYRPLYNIERVEIVKGANALIFGRGAGGGAINRVSKRAPLGRELLGGNASIDTFGAFNISGDLAAPLSGNIAVRLNATYEEFANNRAVYDGRFVGMSPTATLSLGADTTLVASYTYDNDERVTDRGIPAFRNRPLADNYDTFFGDPDYNHSEVEAHIARTRLEHEFTGQLTANATVQYAHYDKFYANIVPSAALDRNGDDVPDAVRVSGYESGTVRENIIGQANLVWTGRTGGIGHTVLMGAEFAYQDTDAIRNRALFADAKTSATVDLSQPIAVPAFILEPQRSSRSELTVYSLYVQDQVRLTGWLELVLGARFDRFELDSVNLLDGFQGARSDNDLSPRVGVIVKPQSNLSLYASYAESFLPAAGDQFTVLSQASAALEPENFDNLEAGIKWAPRGDLLATAAVFRLDRSNTPATTNLGLRVLTGESRVQGAELSLAGSILPNFHVNAGYTYLDGEIRSSTDAAEVGDELQQLPEHQIGAWGRYDLTDRFGIGVGLVHQSSQFASFSNTTILPSYTRIDAAAFYRFNDEISLQVNVENLTDARYYPSAHGDNNIQPGDALSVRFGITAEL